MSRPPSERQVDVGPVDCGIMCYSDTWVQAAGDLGQGVRAWLPTLPFEESDSVPELVRYLFWRGNTFGADGSEPTSIGTLAWASALLFEEAVNIAIGQDQSGIALLGELPADLLGGQCPTENRHVIDDAREVATVVHQEQLGVEEARELTREPKQAA